MVWKGASQVEAGARNPKVDAFIDRADKWRAEYIALREILLKAGLTEELKWGVPCYALDGKNVALIHGFKEYCAVLFVKGALLKDALGLLIRQTDNVQAARQMRFTSVEEIAAREGDLMAYTLEAAEIERAGLSVEFKESADFAVPVEFRARLDESPQLKAAFDALTPGRQRAYLLHFSGARQSATRTARVEKLIPKILAGKGLDD